jgi:TM2 domain-containing membrane protein YozV
MDQSRVDMYIATNAKHFESHQIPYLRDRLLALDDNMFIMIQSANLKDPSTALIISIFGGSYGIDRFYIGDTGLGVAKLLTLGGCGIWTIVDWFTIQSNTKKKNLENVQKFLV